VSAVIDRCLAVAVLVFVAASMPALASNTRYAKIWR